MKIHEYQAKDMFSEYGIPVPLSRIAENDDQAVSAAEKLELPVVVKAQIHAGGRGKGGGVKIAKTFKETRQFAARMLGKPLITHQTGPEGRIVRKVLIEKTADIANEYYVSLLIDRKSKKPVFMVSPAGGMDIETVAKKTPEKIYKEFIDPCLGLLPFQARRLAGFLDLPPAQARKAAKVFLTLWKLFVEKDAAMVEINPLVSTTKGDIMALDGKINLEDTAAFRHPEWKELRDLNEENPQEVEASKYHLNYIKLDGNVGCMVNGAGLAMATMDAIQAYGEEPANFLDVGGGADANQIKNAFRILLSDPNTKAVLVNIFGGILRCDVLAEGIVQAAEGLDIKVPLVIRLEGTNVKEGRKILEKSKLSFKVANSMDEAARMAVKMVRAATKKAKK